VLRGEALTAQSDSLESTRVAQQRYDAALALDPNFVPALAAQVGNWDRLNDVDPRIDRERMLRQMDELSLRAVHLDPTDPAAWDARFAALSDAGQWPAAEEANNKQISLDPLDLRPYQVKAFIAMMVGRPAEALPIVEKAIALDPDHRGWTLRIGCQAHVQLGQYEQAIADCEKAAGTSADWLITSFLAAAYANHGDLDKAVAARRAMLRIVPGYTIEQLRAKHYSDVPEYLKMVEATWYAGLRKAGIPER
jgi:tetratricopeptide (TPR) repeat protein